MNQKLDADQKTDPDSDYKTKRAQLRWRCQRGMLELDMLLLNFFDKEFDNLSAEQQLDFELLLKKQDPELWSYFLGPEQPAEQGLQAIVKLILDCRKAAH